MDPFSAAFAGVVITIILSALALIQVYQNNNLRKLFEDLASRHDGTYHHLVTMVFSNESHVEIPCHGHALRVDIKPKQSKNDTEKTRVRVTVDTYETLESYASTMLFSSLGSMLGGQDITIGYKEYDDMFVIKSSSPNWARRFFALNHEIRYEHIRNNGRRITINGGELEILQPGILWDERQLDELVTFATAIVEWIPKIPALQLGVEHEGALSLARDDAHAGGLTVSKAGGGEISSTEW